MVRRVLFSRITKQSRKGILPFSSISLVNWMLVFCLSVRGIHRFFFVYSSDCIVNVTEPERRCFTVSCSGLFLDVLHDYFSHNEGNSTDYYQRVTLESWFTNFNRTNCPKSLSTFSRTLQTPFRLTGISEDNAQG